MRWRTDGLGSVKPQKRCGAACPKNPSRRCVSIAIFLLLFPVTISSVSALSGIVLDESGVPVSQATVRLQGHGPSATTGTGGRFSLKTGKPATAKYITAARPGYFNGAAAVTRRQNGYTIRLKPVPPGDHPGYRWLPSLIGAGALPSGHPGEAQPCQECHPAVAAQWQQDAHSRAAVNPLFLGFFYGTGPGGRPAAGPGYKLDFPNSNGNCTACHIPAAFLETAIATDPSRIGPEAREGIGCDFCHKIRAAAVDETGGRPGVLSYTFTRPENGRQVFYGPLDDVFPGDDSYHPLYRESQYCAPCHHGHFWNVLAYSEFQEWQESSYARAGIHCQHCHMKPDGAMTRLAEKSKGGITRRPETLSSHVNFGIKDVPFMREAIDLAARAELKDGRLSVFTQVTNTNAGHHYPTGNPMRHLILVVEATNGHGRLELLEGGRLPEWAGVGPAEGNYAGLPGRAYAKVLKDLMLYPDQTRRRDFAPEYPAPHWRPTLIESDTRIPAKRADRAAFHFRLPATDAGPVQVTAKLVFRRAYKKWLDAKGFAVADLELARTIITLTR
jgi:hypothetical protein